MGGNMKKFLEIHNITKIFEGKTPTTALKNISLQINEGEFITFLGPSGCGKSTLLRIIAGLETITIGEITLEGKALGEPSAERGMVFQSYTLFPWLNVRDNILFGLKQKKMPKRQQDEIANFYLEKIGLMKFQDHYPKQLSGGMQQRVALARAMANDPKILLMDEPFGALDHFTRGLMQELLLKIWQDNQKTILFVTHDIEEAIFMGNRSIMLAPHPGTIFQDRAIDFAYPRDYQLKTSAEFTKIKAEITDNIRHF